LILTFIAALAASAPIPAVVATLPPVIVSPAERDLPVIMLQRGAVKLSPQEAVMKAAEAAPDVVPGVFEFTVRRAERAGSNLFVGSEKDYRDQRCLSLRLSPIASAKLRERLGMDPAKALMGHRLLVVGAAQRVRIDFIENGRPSGKYYYQTQVPVVTADQIDVLN